MVLGALLDLALDVLRLLFFAGLHEQVLQALLPSQDAR